MLFIVLRRDGIRLQGLALEVAVKHRVIVTIMRPISLADGTSTHANESTWSPMKLSVSFDAWPEERRRV